LTKKQVFHVNASVIYLLVCFLACNFIFSIVDFDNMEYII